jgi:hypothetical protein
MCCDPPSVVGGVCLSPRVLHFGGDGAEQAAQIGADQGEGGDQRILDRRNPPDSSFDQIRNKSTKGNSPWFNKSNLAQAAAKLL